MDLFPSTETVNKKSGKLFCCIKGVHWSSVPRQCEGECNEWLSISNLTINHCIRKRILCGEGLSLCKIILLILFYIYMPI